MANAPIVADRPDDSTPWDAWQGRLHASRNRRDERVATWQSNVNARKGYPAHQPDATSATLIPQSSSVSVNQDWPLTKAKIAQLYSQTPEVRLSPRDPSLEQAVPIFGRELNETITATDVGATIEEILADVVNASGIGGCLVSCETRTEPREVPTVDPAMLPPDVQAQVMAGQVQLPTQTVDHPVDIRYLCQRISPADLLIPDDFTGSNYDQARWLGEDGRMTWAQAVANLKLTDEQKPDVLGRDRRANGSLNTLNTDTRAFNDTDVVNYTQVFYWRHFYHADETNFHALQRLVFVDGIDEPVVNEPYQAQTRTQDGRLVGVLENPIRILTLTYISDDALPPSDSTISRFQIDELEQSRDAMVQQRKRSIPIRWGDTNRISPNTRAKIDRGENQGFIWTNGPGDRAIGEVSRASFPQEKFEFDAVIKRDLTEIWQVGSNQAGAFAAGERSASEAKIVQQNFQTRVGQERDKVTKFFVGIVKVLAGHLALYGTFEIPDNLGIQREQLATSFSYSVRSDSTVRLDVEEQIDRLTRGINLTAQSGYVNIKPVVSKIWELLGEDPNAIVIDPQPKPPEPVKVSVSKAEDLNDPLFLALLMRTHQGPAPEDLQAAIKLRQSVMIGAPVASAPPPQGDPNAPPTDVQRPEMAHSGWDAAPRIDQRTEDGNA